MGMERPDYFSGFTRITRIPVITLQRKLTGISVFFSNGEFVTACEQHGIPGLSHCVRVPNQNDRLSGIC